MLEDDFKTSHSDLMSLNYPSDTTTKKEEEEEAQHSMIDTMKPASLPTRKSVDFAILPPPKRTRACSSTPWTAKHVVDGAYRLSSFESFSLFPHLITNPCLVHHSYLNEYHLHRTS
jgi:hypothetical protein